MKVLSIFMGALLISGCVVYPEFWDQDPRPSKRSSAAFYDNHASASGFQSNNAGRSVGDDGNYSGPDSDNPNTGSIGDDGNEIGRD